MKTRHVRSINIDGLQTLCNSCARGIRRALKKTGNAAGPIRHHGTSGEVYFCHGCDDELIIIGRKRKYAG